MRYSMGKVENLNRLSKYKPGVVDMFDDTLTTNGSSKVIL